MTTDPDVVPDLDGRPQGRPVRRATFGGLDIAWDPRVLEPREWTLEQSLWAASILDDVPAGPVLELCCGAGQIGLRAVVGSVRPLVCVDANPVAASYTLENARAAGLEDRVSVRTGWIEEVLEPGELFPLIVADPPWVPHDETGQFPEDPTLAIDGGGDGMDVVRTCTRAIEGHLAPGGAAVLQLGTVEQARLVEDIARGLTAGEVRVFERGVLLRLDA
jgi:methylase of polypeptide subunit release factors